MDGKDHSSGKSNKGSNGNGSTPKKYNINHGRWSDEEHQRFLQGLDTFGTGNWKKITDLVGTRSCTQVRTHAQKYFQALQKAPADGSSSTGVTGEGGVRKKSRLLGEHLKDSNKNSNHNKNHKDSTNGSSDSNSNKMDELAKGLAKRYGGWNQQGMGRKRGLTGMSLLAQAAATDMEYEEEFEKLDQTVDEYESRHPSSRNYADGASEAGESDEEESDGSDAGEDDDEDGEGREDDTGVKKERDDGEDDQPLKKKQKAGNGFDSERFPIPYQSLSGVPEGSKQELQQLREQVQVANLTIQQMRKQVQDAENRAVEAIEGRNRALNECRELQEINAQLRAEHRRLAMSGAAASAPGNGQLAAALGDPMRGLAFHPGMTQAQHQDQVLIEVLQARLKEAEIRYHQVTESLSRQTGVLSDQHRAILELNGKLEGERAKRQALEVELGQLKRRS